MNSTSIQRRTWLKQAGITLAALPFISADHLADNAVIKNPYTGQWLYEPRENVVKARLWRNENPFGPSKLAKQKLIEALPESNRYAFERIQLLQAEIAALHNLEPENVMITAGSSEVLVLGGIAFGADKGSIVTAYPTFNTLMATATRIGADWTQVPLQKDMQHDLQAMEDAIDSKTRLIYICNPNNPTGTLTNQNDINSFCKRVSQKVPVMVDEAYTEFMPDGPRHSVVPLIKEGYDIVVAKTFSKIHGFAGLRIGYALGTKKSIGRLHKYSQWPVTPNGPAVEAARASLQDSEFEAFCRAKNDEARNATYEILNQLKVPYLESHTSFVLFQIPESPQAFLPKMEQEGVGVRGWSFAGKHWCRVSMGTMDDMQLFGNAVKKLL